jgi:hypothetical protein
MPKKSISGKKKEQHMHIVQGTIGGGRAFDPIKDCTICEAKLLRLQYRRAGWGEIRVQILLGPSCLVLP